MGWRTQIDIVGILIVFLTVCGSSTTLGPQACTVEQPQVELVV